VLAGIIVCGGLVGPALMLFGLARLSGVTGALLLNLEAPFTMLLAVLLFREHLSGRELAAAAVIVAGGVLLERRPGELQADWVGVVCIAGACASWGLDNNLTQRLSVRDPVAVVRWKTLGAGGLMAGVALAAGESFPSGATLAAALIVGALSYGVSLLLDTVALRLLGAAREAAIFASAPFAGAVLAVPLLGEPVRAVDVVAGALMLGAVVALARARHGHRHAHEVLEHEHVHVHDEHHAHAHDGAVDEPHTHAHRHEAITHEHAHVSDVHHRHRHD
jgi:drug/metabolite transporter (DMT)-like permease